MRKGMIHILTMGTVLASAVMNPLAAQAADITVYGNSGSYIGTDIFEMLCPDYSIPAPESPLPDQSDHTNSAANQDAWMRRIIELVNEERTRVGVSELSQNSKAMSAAQVRAREIVRVFSHTRPDGRGFSTALKEAGISYSRSGENIAYGQKTPEEVMKGWMNSAGHRANILNPEFASMGVGYVEDSSGTAYWVQLFVN